MCVFAFFLLSCHSNEPSHKPLHWVPAPAIDFTPMCIWHMSYATSGLSTSFCYPHLPVKKCQQWKTLAIRKLCVCECVRVVHTHIFLFALLGALILLSNVLSEEKRSDLTKFTANVTRHGTPWQLFNMWLMGAEPREYTKKRSMQRGVKSISRVRCQCSSPWSKLWMYCREDGRCLPSPLSMPLTG